MSRAAVPTLGAAVGAVLAAAFLLAGAPPALAEDAPALNGFALVPGSVPPDQILRGGPPRDGIRALVDPTVVAAEQAPWGDDEIVIGVQRGSAARAYPLAILSWHELVNDTLGGEPILVSYCPLCGTGLVFDRKVAGRARTFGVSGLLYRSDLLLYDRESESLWSQIEATAITGPLTGERLTVLRSAQISWGAWKRAHADTSVLSPDTGYKRDYARAPYGDYALSERLLFPAPFAPRYHPKMPTLGLRVRNGAARGYPALEIARNGGRVEDVLDGRRVVVRYDPETQVFAVEAPADVEVIEAYWFAWSAFHPEASVFTADEDPAP